MERTDQPVGLKTLDAGADDASRKKLYERPLVIDWGSVAEITGGVAGSPGDLGDLNGSRPF